MPEARKPTPDSHHLHHGKQLLASGFDESTPKEIRWQALILHAFLHHGYPKLPDAP
jgi:hypothetical protein